MRKPNKITFHVCLNPYTSASTSETTYENGKSIVPPSNTKGPMATIFVAKIFEIISEPTKKAVMYGNNFFSLFVSLLFM